MIRALAKINLDLRILASRPDGYHEVRTVYQSIALHDTILFDRDSGELSLECDDPDVPTDRTNLVWQAADRLWRAAGRRGRPRGVRITIAKRIPMSAGLGGGSSDAAATLVALTRLWKDEIPASELRAIAAEIGADVPYFLEGGRALGLGRGDELYALAEPARQWVLIALPSFGISTAEAYRWYDEELARSRGRRGRAASAVRNDLEPAVVQRHPEIGRIAARLGELGAIDRGLSGSGSAVFGLFRSRTALEAAYRAVVEAGCRAERTRTVPRAEYAHKSRPRAVEQLAARARPRID